MSVDFQRARELAAERIRKIEQKCGIPLAIFDGYTRTFDRGWIFYWNTEAAVTRGDYSDLIAGNAPLVLFKEDGSIRSAPTAYAEPEEILKWIDEHHAQSSQDCC